MIRVCAVVGPTASGKSALAIELARSLDGEIVSCDSMQLYRGMDIGTAKPTKAEQEEIVHHMIDILSPMEKCSAADYAAAAFPLLKEIAARGKLPIFCGGTGLYLESVLYDRYPVEIPAFPACREALYNLARERGNEYLHQRLFAVDPEAAAAIHPNNVKRVVRALEIYEGTGISKSEWDRRSKGIEPRVDAVVIGLRFEDRQLLYSRIDKRVDQMIANGLVEETEKLYDAGFLTEDTTAAQAIGYKELLPYLKGECGLDTAVSYIKQATRRYAKRQMTWFRAKSYIHWITVDEGGEEKTFKEIVNNAVQIYNNS